MSTSSLQNCNFFFNDITSEMLDDVFNAVLPDENGSVASTSQMGNATAANNSVPPSYSDATRGNDNLVTLYECTPQPPAASVRVPTPQHESQFAPAENFVQEVKRKSICSMALFYLGNNKDA